MKKTGIIITFFLVYLNSSAQVLNDNPLKTQLDSAVDRSAKLYLSKTGRVGISIGVIYHQRDYRYNYGQTAPKSGALTRSNSIYEIGSITKTFTGLLVAHAIGEGKMKLDEDIRKYLPGNFPTLQYPSGEPVRVGYLLSHTAMFPNSFTDGDISVPMTEAYFLDHLQRIKLDSLKTLKYAYSNVGYQLLGYALEHIYQADFETLIKRYITGPLHMTNTFVNRAAAKLDGYTASGEKAQLVQASFPGAGGLHSCIDDMLKYADYQLAEKDAAVKLTHRVIYGNVEEDAVGFQWAIGRTRNWDYYIRIDGGTNGFRSFCSLYPNEQAAIILLTNEKDDQAGGDLYRLTTAILKTLKSGHFPPN
ncbi:serine hydrolase domain-containing protein [Chitinophaga sp. RCC_12]|uniref:serine hydrolase domain-containing protein n=1 Tax=Chitinophaga sp. RCC_12 TaxID=3239226 RepID=UPI0035255F5D